MPQNKYLFIPSQPTPNGPLHLGHIAGAFLSMDVMTRFLRAEGHEAALVTGADRFDVYVRRSAQLEGRSCAASADAWTAQMRRDLATFNIGLDAYSNPADPEQSEAYPSMLDTLFQDLKNLEALELISEKAPYDAEGVCLSGFGSGTCPSCSAGVSGYFCEACARVMRPEEMIKPEFPTVVSWRSVQNAFFRSPADNRALTAATLSALSAQASMLREAFQRHYAEAHLVRLTTNSTWGLKPPVTPQHDTTFFTGHSSEYEHMGALAQAAMGWEHHPFRTGSDIISVNSFGFDNTTCVLGELAIALARPSVKPFDHYMPSYFLTLEGQKFSTSRKVAVFVHDIATMGIRTDVIRLHLARCDLRTSEADFRVDDLAALNTSVERWWQRVLAVAKDLSTHAEAQLPSPGLHASTAATIRDCLQPNNIRIADAAAELVHLMQTVNAPTFGTERAWLTEMARLLAPFLPETAGAIRDTIATGQYEALVEANPVLSQQTLDTLRGIVVRRTQSQHEVGQELV